MREIVLDTETTGLDPKNGDRIVEIGCVELINHIPSGETFHVYINPERAMPEEAFRVHGLSTEFLSDKPVFSDVAQDFIDFTRNAVLVIHNAAFDMAFINTELAAVDRPAIPMHAVIDTLDLARRKHPGAQNSLDALCSRYGIDSSHRELHGALLDADLLALVYIELIGGRQSALELATTSRTGEATAKVAQHRVRQSPLAPRLTDADRNAHWAFVKTLGAAPLWARYDHAFADKAEG